MAAGQDAPAGGAYFAITIAYPRSARAVRSRVVPVLVLLSGDMPLLLDERVLRVVLVSVEVL
jgi:hypothetical protein